MWFLIVQFLIDQYYLCIFWWGSGAMYCYPKPNPKSVSEDEELQKFKLNKGAEWILGGRGGEEKNCFKYNQYNLLLK